MNKSAQRNAQESRWDMEKSIHSGWNKNILKIFEKKREKLKINKPDSWTNEKWRAWRSTRVLTDSCCENVSFRGEFREADKVLASSQQLYSSREEKNQCKSVCEKRPQFPVIFWKIKDCINDKLRGKMQKNKGTSHQVWFFFSISYHNPFAQFTPCRAVLMWAREGKKNHFLLHLSMFLICHSCLFNYRCQQWSFCKTSIGHRNLFKLAKV